MFRPEKSISHFRDGYATHADFCSVLESDLNSLYLLAFLLTANHQEAERCFLATVDKAFRERTVFKEWTRSWVRRSLIRAAIAVVRPNSPQKDEKRDFAGHNPSSTNRGIERVAQLNPLERFVFVVSVLERHSIQECSLLLGCSPKDVAQARMRAFRELPEWNSSYSRVKSPPSPFLEVPA